MTILAHSRGSLNLMVRSSSFNGNKPLPSLHFLHDSESDRSIKQSRTLQLSTVLEEMVGLYSMARQQWSRWILVMALIATHSLANAANPSSSPPNFVIVLTDDLDWTLGGTHASTLQRTRKLLGEQGKTFTNWFVQTPVCCPSRAEFLTGKMFHNLRLPSLDSGSGCMHVDVTSDPSHPFYQRDYFAQHFQRLNYTVGIFGKHLNGANPTDFMPEGVDEMFINDDGDYYDPIFFVGTIGAREPQSVHFDNCSATTGMPCYSTSIIGNASLAWIQRHMENSNSNGQPPKPFFAIISVKAPHILDGPGFPVSIPAPWYNSTIIPEQLAPRTPNYNYSALDHHWIVRNQLPLTEEEATKVDALYVSRLKTLMSVDDLVEDLMRLVDPILNNTYVMFTSDNGFRLGQFRMPMGKWHPYENDVRVPMMMRGPGLEPNTTSALLSTHVNLMPTLLGLASQDSTSNAVPATMDGINLASCILYGDYDDSCITSSSSSLLLDYFTLGSPTRYNHTVVTSNHTFLALRTILSHDIGLVSSGAQDLGTSTTHWMYSFDFAAYQQQDDPSGPTTHATTTPEEEAQVDDDTNGYYLLRNFKYVEYREPRDDWNATFPPLEQELFDLDQDPYEMYNIVGQVSPRLMAALEWKIQRMRNCQGDGCRREHAGGIMLNQTIELSVEVDMP